MQGKDRHTVRRGWLLRARGRRRAGFYPLGGKPLLDGALELVVGRFAGGGWRRTVRMRAVIAVVAHDRRWWDCDRWSQRTLRIAERTHA